MVGVIVREDHVADGSRTDFAQQFVVFFCAHRGRGIDHHVAVVSAHEKRIAESERQVNSVVNLPGSGLPVRVHGAFVSDEEVHRVVEKLREQGEPNYIEGILEGGVTSDGDEGSSGAEGTGAGGGESDPLYDQAVEVVIKNRRASISLVQRHLRIGYNRAARLLEQMEQSGLVSAMSSNGNREILTPAREAE